MFGKRFISSIVIVAVALLTILQGGYILAGVLLVLSLIAYRELMKACKLTPEGKKPGALEITGYAGITVYYMVLVLTENPIFLFMAFIVTLMAFMFLYVFAFPVYHAQDIMSALFNVAYAPIMLSFIYLVRDLTYGVYLVWMIFISSWICDTCAYLSGMLLGKHKLAPKLSPKKSIEGAIGGIVGSALVGALFGYFLVEPVIREQQITLVLAVISMVGAIISQVGDLAASAIKRNHEIKDYGKLIPGHGGIMDRFDSVIFTAPMIYLMAILLIHG